MYYYGARWYDPVLGRFIQPDTVIPDPGDAKTFDRFAYGNNNPLRFTDPSGHYGDDVHYDLTLSLGYGVAAELSAVLGVNEAELRTIAETIANSDVGTDRNPLTEPLGNAFPWTSTTIENFGEVAQDTPGHFYHFERLSVNQDRSNYAIGQADPWMFGQALHGYQDWYSHVGSGYTLPAGAAGVAQSQEYNPGLWSQTQAAGATLTQRGSDFGHLFNWVANLPVVSSVFGQSGNSPYTDTYYFNPSTDKVKYAQFQQRDAAMTTNSRSLIRAFMLGYINRGRSLSTAHWWHSRYVEKVDVPCSASCVQ